MSAENTQTKQTHGLAMHLSRTFAACEGKIKSPESTETTSLLILIVTEDSTKFKQSSSNSKFLCEDQL